MEVKAGTFSMLVYRFLRFSTLVPGQVASTSLGLKGRRCMYTHDVGIWGLPFPTGSENDVSPGILITDFFYKIPISLN